MTKIDMRAEELGNEARKETDLAEIMFFFSHTEGKRCTTGRKKVAGGSVMLLAVFCCEALGPSIVTFTMTHTT